MEAHYSVSGSLVVKYLRKQHHLLKGAYYSSKPLVEPLVESKTSNFLISKSIDTVPITSISVAFSLPQSEETETCKYPDNSSKYY